MAVLLSGCSTVDVGSQRSSQLYLGLVRVIMPERRKGLAAVDVKALGLGWDQGVWVGGRHGNWVIADPAECQLLIVIRTPAQAANAARVLRSMEGKQACVADYTKH